MKLALAADLHFGSVPEGLSMELRDAILQQKPDGIVIAGDLTLGARRSEFEQAGIWLRSLTPQPLLLPGNHDLPYLNLLERFIDPFKRFRGLAGSGILMPMIECPEGIVLGFNTARSWQPHLRWQEGVARSKDVEAAREALSRAPFESFKAVATHHPMLRVPGMDRIKPVRRAQRALQVFAQSGVDLLMSGHTHQSFAVQTETGGHPLVAIGAPTALSTRKRGEENGFCMIEIIDDAIICTLWLRSASVFRPALEKVFKRIRSGGAEI
jgi:3',5'-cyclic AMP phosphodiesterase CpdA